MAQHKHTARQRAESNEQRAPFIPGTFGINGLSFSPPLSRQQLPADHGTLITISNLAALGDRNIAAAHPRLLDNRCMGRNIVDKQIATVHVRVDERLRTPPRFMKRATSQGSKKW
jgi:hypothetical protein